MDRSDPDAGVRLIARGAALLLAAALTALHFWVPQSEDAAAAFMVALFLLTALALSA